jgi:potassium efflux system protein
MPNCLQSRRLFAQVIIWLAFTTSAIAQSPPPKPESVDALLGRVADGRKQLDQARDLDDALKAKARDYFDKAQGELERAKAAEAKIATFQQQVGQAPEELGRTKAELAALPSQPATSVDDDAAALAQIEQAVARAEAELERWRREAQELETELKGRAGRRTEIPKRIAAAQQVLAETAAAAPTPVGEENPTVQSARVLMLAARQRAAELEIQSCQEELKAFDARAELLPLRRDLAARRATLAEQEVKRLQELVNRRRQQEAEAQARQAAWEASQAHPAMQRLMEENARLADKRKLLAGQIADATRRLDEVNGQLGKVSEQFASVQKKANSVGLANVIGPLLRRQRAALPELGDSRRNVAACQQAMGEGELARLELQEQRFALSDLDQQTKNELKDLDLPAAGRQLADLEAAVREALQTKRDYLDTLIAEHEKYYDKLDKLKTAAEKLIAETESCSLYIDQRVLWIASAEPISLADAAPAAHALLWLAGPRAGLELGGCLLGDIRANAAAWAAALAVFAALVYWRRRMRARIVEIGEKTVRGSCCRFLPTVEVVALTALMSLAWPGLFWWIGWRLWSATPAADVCKALGAGMTTTARVFLALELVRLCCAPGGLAEAHFDWSAAALRLLRKHIRWFKLAALPLMCVAVTMTWQDNDQWDASLGRFCCLAALACFAWALNRVFRPSGVVFQTMIADRRGGWLERLRYVWYPLLSLTPAALALLAAVGYHYTARQLATRLILTAYVLVGGIVARALLLRWALVSKRKLAMEEARKRRAAQSESSVGEESAAAELPASAQPQRDLAVINAQTRHLIEYSLTVAAALALWCAWVDVLPALGILNSVMLWGTNISVTMLIAAALTLATTVIAAKNIPGLLEMAVLQHLPLEAGSRYALATVSRYLITIVGVVCCCSELGLGWSKVQWLVAAMSLGLGFGLQEIFANFISGLIILFECPVRVGDVVTIGETSGVVSRIRMRATTITDWDRKELIIPNKEFITGRVLNWTLSNAVNRVTISVGVAYGADAERTKTLLLRIAQEHPLVLRDPPPHAMLESFGASSLNFVLRCYLPNLDNRGTVIHELHVAVDREFRAAGIEIAFPQHDIHVRTLDLPLDKLFPATAMEQPAVKQSLAADKKAA